ncbi:MAG: hypothetical protein ACRETL_15710, partial [Gammaproteobacteria bacterium]
METRVYCEITASALTFCGSGGFAATPSNIIAIRGSLLHPGNGHLANQNRTGTDAAAHVHI